MDIQSEKLYLIEQLTKLQDINIILKVKELLQGSIKEKEVGYNEDGSIITESELIERAEVSNKAIKEKRTKSIDQIRAEMKDW